MKRQWGSQDGPGWDRDHRYQSWEDSNEDWYGKSAWQQWSWSWSSWQDWQDPAEQSWHQQWSEENEVQDDQYPVGDVA